MISPKAKEQILKVVDSIEKGAEVEAVATELLEIRKVALELEDPLMVKTLRLIAEKLKEDESFEFDIEIEVPEDDEEEYEAPENHLTYLLSLMADSDNKYNREEIKWYRTALWEEIY